MRRMIPMPQALAESMFLVTRSTPRRCGPRLSVPPYLPWGRTTSYSFVAGRPRPHQVHFSFVFPRTQADRYIAAPTPKPKPTGPVAPATPFIRKPVLKATASSPLQSVVTSLAADGAVTQALTHSLDSTVAHLPDVFKSTAPAHPVVAVQNTIATVKAASPALLGKFLTPSFIPPKVQLVAMEVAQWWSHPRASRLADCSVPNRATDALIAEGKDLVLKFFVEAY